MTFIFLNSATHGDSKSSISHRGKAEYRQTINATVVGSIPTKGVYSDIFCRDPELPLFPVQYFSFKQTWLCKDFFLIFPRLTHAHDTHSGRYNIFIFSLW